MKTTQNPEMSTLVAPRVITDGTTILATVDVAASPERVFTALNTRETEAWWGAADVYRQTAWTSDLRVGGRWHVITRTADGNSLPAGGEFIEIDAPRKVVITRSYEFDFPILGRRSTTVTYLCDPIPTGARVTVRHDGFAGLREPADLHAFGWERVLTWLRDYFQSGVAS